MNGGLIDGIISINYLCAVNVEWIFLCFHQIKIVALDFSIIFIIPNIIFIHRIQRFRFFSVSIWNFYQKIQKPHLFPRLVNQVWWINNKRIFSKSDEIFTMKFLIMNYKFIEKTRIWTTIEGKILAQDLTHIKIIFLLLHLTMDETFWLPII